MDDDDPLPSYGLSKIRLDHKPIFDLCFSTCRTRLSDYTFANTYIWRDSIHLRWRMLHDCLCVFANGDGGLTMLFPPLGPGDVEAATPECMDICEDYNSAAGLTRWTRVEYVSQDLLPRLRGFQAEPMSGDYVYSTARMIDLAGGDLASKRQARNRFARRYEARTERLTPGHAAACLELLATWQEQTGDPAAPGLTCVRLKRAKEIAATADALVHAQAMGLVGLALYARPQGNGQQEAGSEEAGQRLVGFTLGERLTPDTCSILIEKCDRQFTGSAQYIFSEFCRQCWSGTTWCNVGDDWDVPSLAWTKQSYRPAFRLPKWVLRPVPVDSVVVPEGSAAELAPAAK